MFKDVEIFLDVFNSTWTTLQRCSENEASLYWKRVHSYMLAMTTESFWNVLLDDFDFLQGILPLVLIFFSVRRAWVVYHQMAKFTQSCKHLEIIFWLLHRNKVSSFQGLATSCSFNDLISKGCKAWRLLVGRKQFGPVLEVMLTGLLVLQHLINYKHYRKPTGRGYGSPSDPFLSGEAEILSSSWYNQI